MAQTPPLERTRKCRRCNGTNTEKIGTSDDHTQFVYIGWCRDCRDDYGYLFWIDTVFDKRNRL